MSIHRHPFLHAKKHIPVGMFHYKEFILVFGVRVKQCPPHDWPDRDEHRCCTRSCLDMFESQGSIKCSATQIASDVSSERPNKSEVVSAEYRDAVREHEYKTGKSDILSGDLEDDAVITRFSMECGIAAKVVGILLPIHPWLIVYLEVSMLLQLRMKGAVA